MNVWTNGAMIFTAKFDDFPSRLALAPLHLQLVGGETKAFACFHGISCPVFRQNLARQGSEMLFRPGWYG
jgi:hypothetical protein